MPFNSVLETIGKTPHIRLSRMFPEAEIWVKSERGNPGGSIKDRIALAMVEAAEASGALAPGGLIIEPTSGNTGIGLAFVCASRGYKLILTMPESVSIERRKMLAFLGAELELTPRAAGMSGAVARAKELLASTPGAVSPKRWENSRGLSGMCIRASRLQTIPNSSSNGSVRTSPRIEVTVEGAFSSSARSLAMLIISGERSTPVTMAPIVLAW